MEQPWLDEASNMNPYTYHITINGEAAQKRGIEDEDMVEIESAYGRKVQGHIKVMEGQHPQTIGIAACSGHWARGMPIAKGKGTNFDILLENDLEHCDPVSLNLETAVRVKIRSLGRD
jgi:anaerobic selenocysteine-containing dehydrogenase